MYQCFFNLSFNAQGNVSCYPQSGCQPNEQKWGSLFQPRHSYNTQGFNKLEKVLENCPIQSDFNSTKGRFPPVTLYSERP